MLGPSSNPFSPTVSLISLSLMLSLPFPLKGETIALPKSPSSAFIHTRIYVPKPGMRGEDRRTVPHNRQINHPQGVLRRRWQGRRRHPPTTLVEFIGRSQLHRKSGNEQSKMTVASAGPGVFAGNHGPESSRGSLQVQALAPSAAGAKPVDASGQRSAKAIPKALSSQSALGESSGSAVPSAPPEVPFFKNITCLQQLGVHGVITLNEPYETLVPSSL